MKKILMIAHECERWGPARLPEPLAASGLSVAVMCAKQNPLCHSSYITRHFEMAELKSWRAFGKILRRAMTEHKADLIIPCDEPVVVMLHHFIRHETLALRYLTRAQLQVLAQSIGQRERLGAMVLKHETRLLAEMLKVAVPATVLATSAGDAVQKARGIGFPVFVKKSFSWAGRGSILCGDEKDVAKAFMMLSDSTYALKYWARRVFARDWFPATSDIEVQKAIAGDSVMYSVACWRGRVVGGLFAGRQTLTGPQGPSTVVEIGDHETCNAAATKMIASMGASGFVAFDFMRCEKTGAVFLLECNPRPNQICHLGDQVGVDLCGLLAKAMAERPGEAATANDIRTVALFPQEWLRNEQDALSGIDHLDVPKKDSKLFNFMLQRGIDRGRSIDLLTMALKKQPLSTAVIAQ